MDAASGSYNPPPRAAPKAMDAAKTKEYVYEEWDAALPSLQEFVHIPNLTVARDKEWETNGLLDKAVNHVVEWIKAQELPDDITIEVLKDPGFSPFLYVEVAGTQGSAKAAQTWVMYGHLDKQPWGEGWEADIAPDSGLIRDGKLYGRGAADDGYAPYSCIIALKALAAQGVEHPRIVLILECCEESGSPHLGHYVEKLAPRIGVPGAVFCLDSLIEDYNTFWVTTSLRGAVALTLEVSLIKNNLHSGVFGGIVPDASRITRLLLARLEDTETGKVLLPELFTKIPVERQEQMKAVADSIGRPDINKKVPWQEGAHPQQTTDFFALYRAAVWEPSLCVIGQEGLPSFPDASPALQNSVRTMLAIRLPPLVDENVAKTAIKAALERDPPCGATVKVDVKMAVPGWNAPDMKPPLETAVLQACRGVFDGRDPGYAGGGGTIPLMKMLGDMFPESELLASGVLGPGSNEHGPNESLHIEYVKKFTATIALVMGNFQPEEDNWPEGVPRPIVQSTRRVKPKFCFNNDKILIGQCKCCF